MSDRSELKQKLAQRRAMMEQSRGRGAHLNGFGGVGASAAHIGSEASVRLQMRMEAMQKTLEDRESVVIDTTQLQKDMDVLLEMGSKLESELKVVSAPRKRFVVPNASASKPTVRGCPIFDVAAAVAAADEQQAEDDWGTAVSIKKHTTAAKQRAHGKPTPRAFDPVEMCEELLVGEPSR